MFIEALDKLRCIRDHEDSWLVAKFVEMQARDFWQGELGCPVCEARYAVRSGVVFFSTEKLRLSALPVPEADDTFALAAMLDLSTPERTIVLCDEWTAHAAGLMSIAEPQIFSVNSASQHYASEQVHELVSSDTIPLARDSVDAAALGEHSSEQMIVSAVRALRPSGRLVGHAVLQVPPEVTVIATDSAKWVAEKNAGFIPLRRASR